jgi:hypothetical protein
MHRDSASSAAPSVLTRHRRKPRMRRFLFWATGLLLLTTLALVLLTGYLVLDHPARAAVLARMHREGLYPQALTDLQADNSAHYGVHLLLGRTLALCPCTRRLADAQYSRARFHARTKYQRALVTTARPRTVAAVVSDTFQLGISSLQWLGGHLPRL